MRLACALSVAAVCFLAAFPASSLADEGLWPLDHLPADSIEARYGFRPTAEWVERFRQACVAFPGGSGAFVSPSGLVITNHHVARG